MTALGSIRETLKLYVGSLVFFQWSQVELLSLYREPRTLQFTRTKQGQYVYSMDRNEAQQLYEGCTAMMVAEELES